MLRLFTGSNVFYDGKFVKRDFLINNSQRFEFFEAEKHSNLKFDEIIDCSEMHVFPGFIDPHVHLREPGFEYKDTIKTSTLSAAKGGYTTVFAMPNLNPVPDCIKNLNVQKNLIDKNAVIHVFPVCAITKGQTGRGDLSDLKELSVKNKLFSDDGKGVQDKKNMENAMIIASQNNAYILAHCEDEEILSNGDSYAAEYVQIQRDLELAKKTNCNYHICHISTKKSLDAFKKYQDSKISAEVTCHHLLLNENDIEDNGKWKMNPPLRSVKDQKALCDAFIDGTLNIICTDNAPHSAQEKDCAYNDSLMGIVSIEIAFPLIYTNFVKKNKITLEYAINCMSSNVAKRFNINGGKIKENELANLCIYDLSQKWTINSNEFASMGKSCPFDGKDVYGKCKITIIDGEIVYREK